jgi:hypothetical protein
VRSCPRVETIKRKAYPSSDLLSASIEAKGSGTGARSTGDGVGETIVTRGGPGAKRGSSRDKSGRPPPRFNAETIGCVGRIGGGGGGPLNGVDFMAGNAGPGRRSALSVVTMDIGF